MHDETAMTCSAPRSAATRPRAARPAARPRASLSAASRRPRQLPPRRRRRLELDAGRRASSASRPKDMTDSRLPMRLASCRDRTAASARPRHRDFSFEIAELAEETGQFEVSGFVENLSRERCDETLEGLPDPLDRRRGQPRADAPRRLRYRHDAASHLRRAGRCQGLPLRDDRASRPRACPRRVGVGEGVIVGRGRRSSDRAPGSGGTCS